MKLHPIRLIRWKYTNGAASFCQSSLRYSRIAGGYTVRWDGFSLSGVHSSYGEI